MENHSLENPPLQSTPVIKQGVPHYQHRTLIGWLDDQLAGEALASFREDTPENYLMTSAAARVIVQARSPFVPTNPLCELAEDPLLEAIRVRPETQPVVAGWKWRFAQVDLNQVLTFQPTVRIDNLEARIPSAPLCQEQLYELCFPSSELAAPEEINIELTDAGYMINTLNPNIHVLPRHKVGSSLLPPQPPLVPAGIPFSPGVSPLGVMIVPFVMMKNPGYLQVVQFGDRYFIRDGYHRATAFLQRNISIVPCIHLEAQNPQQIGCLQSGMFGMDILMGTHPPCLRDFWDNAVSCDSLYPAKRRVFLVEMRGLAVLR